MSGGKITISLRGEDGIVTLSCMGIEGASDFECELIVESGGFSADRVAIISASELETFRERLRLACLGKAETAKLRDCQGGFSLDFGAVGGQFRVHCSIDDRHEGKGDSLVVDYSIEGDYREEFLKLFAAAA
jgi:hypothetical protein